MARDQSGERIRVRFAEGHVGLLRIGRQTAQGRMQQICDGISGTRSIRPHGKVFDYRVRVQPLLAKGTTHPQVGSGTTIQRMEGFSDQSVRGGSSVVGLYESQTTLWISRVADPKITATRRLVERSSAK